MPPTAILSVGRGTDGGGDTVTDYFPIAGRLTYTQTETFVQCLIRNATTLRNLFVRVTTNATTVASTFRTRVDGGNGNLSVSISNGATGTFEDTADSDSVASGGKINYQMVPGSANNFGLTLASVTLSDTATFSFPIMDTNLASANFGASSYFPPCGDGEAVSTTESDAQQTMRYSFTASNFYVDVDTNTLSTSSTARTRKNGGNGAESVSISNGATGFFEDITNSDSYVSGDSFNYQLVASGTSGSVGISTFGVKSLPSSNFSYLLSASNSGGVATSFNTTAYLVPDGNLTNATTESTIQLKTRSNPRLQNLFVRSTANTLSVASTVRTRVNAGNGNLSVSISNGATGTFEDITHTDTLNATSLINYQIVTAGTAGSLTLTIVSVNALGGLTATDTIRTNDRTTRAKMISVLNSLRITDQAIRAFAKRLFDAVRVASALTITKAKQIIITNVLRVADYARRTTTKPFSTPVRIMDYFARRTLKPLTGAVRIVDRTARTARKLLLDALRVQDYRKFTVAKAIREIVRIRDYLSSRTVSKALNDVLRIKDSATATLSHVLKVTVTDMVRITDYVNRTVTKRLADGLRVSSFAGVGHRFYATLTEIVTVLAGGAVGNLQRVQGPVRAFANGVSSFTLTLGSAPTSGNVIILAAGILDASAQSTTIGSITQTGVIWTGVGNGLQKRSQPTTSDETEIWLGTVGPGADPTMTINMINGNTPQAIVVDACEYSGLSSTLTTLDKTANSSATNTSTGDTGTTPATSQPSELCIGSIWGDSINFQFCGQSSPTNGFTQLDGADDETWHSHSLGYLEKIVSVTGTQEVQITFAGAVDVTAGCIATFKAVVGGRTLSIMFTHPMSEVVQIVERRITRTVRKAFTDILRINDYARRSAVKSVLINSAVRIVDYAATFPKAILRLSERLRIVDSTVRRVSKILQETVRVQDYLGRRIVTKILMDIVRIRDYSSIVKSFARAFTASIRIVDRTVQSTTKSLTHTVRIQERASRIISKALRDTLRIGDSLVTRRIVTKTITSALKIADSTVRTTLKTLMDSARVQERVTRTVSKFFSTIVRIRDAVTLSRAKSLLFTDGVFIRDYVVRQTTKPLRDMVRVADRAARTILKMLAFTDALRIRDNVFTKKLIIVFFTEAVRIGDYAAKTVSKFFTDIVRIVDRTNQGHAFTLAFREVVNIIGVQFTTSTIVKVISGAAKKIQLTIGTYLEHLLNPNEKDQDSVSQT